MSAADGEKTQYRAGIVVASTRAAKGERADASAPVLHTWLRNQGFSVLAPVIVADGEPMRAAMLEFLGQQIDVLLTTGGTGLTPDDQTPEMTKPLLEREIPGIMEAIRAAGRENTPMAALSRGYAGIAQGALLVNLPGSSAGIADGLAVLEPILAHLLAQLGGNHEH